MIWANPTLTMGQIDAMVGLACTMQELVLGSECFSHLVCTIKPLGISLMVVSGRREEVPIGD